MHGAGGWVDRLGNTIVAKWQSCCAVGWDQPGCVSSRANYPSERPTIIFIFRRHRYRTTHGDCCRTTRFPPSWQQGAPSALATFGNKLSVSGGIFVLGWADATLSQLGNSEVTELIVGVLSNLVEGDILQMREDKLDGAAKMEVDCVRVLAEFEYWVPGMSKSII